MRPQREILKEGLGFTLIEIVVSTVILTILAGGIFSTLSFAKRMSIRAQERAIAVSIVEKKLNELMLQSVTSLEDSVETTARSTHGLDGALMTTVTDAVPEDSSQSPDPAMKEVQVKFDWTDRFNTQRTESAATVFYQG